MKVLFILSKDVYNIPAVKIAEEMLCRGYQINFYGEYLDHIHLRMFEKLKVLIQPISDLNIDSIINYDFVYSARTLEALPYSLLNIRKYIFHFTTTPFDGPNGYGDFTFTQRDMKLYFQDEQYISMEKIKEIKSYPGKAVGNPKYDYTIEKKQINKQILFVDASHFPFGEKGKMEEAQMLLDIAEKLPEYKLVIKPRFFHQDKNVTHRNEIHLYDCLKQLTEDSIPSNIECIEQHVDLGEKVMESEIIITPDMTSTYLDIGVFNKKGLIASGLPNNEDSLICNPGHIKRFCNIAQRSGLCVPYTEILKFLPEGKVFNEQHKIEMGINKKNVSKNIVDIIEQIYKQFIKIDVYPGIEEKTEYDQSIMTIEEVVSVRYIKRLFSLFETIKYRIPELDFFEVEDFIFNLLKNKIQIDQDNYDKYQNTVSIKIRNVILNNKDILMDNELKQSYYLQFLYDAGKFHLEQENDYLAKHMFCYLKGKYEITVMNNAKVAMRYLKRFFDAVRQNKYEKTLADGEYYMESATYWIGVCYFMLEELSLAEKIFEYLEKITNDKHVKAREYLDIISKKKKEKHC